MLDTVLPASTLPQCPSAWPLPSQGLDGEKYTSVLLITFNTGNVLGMFDRWLCTW